VVTYIHPMATRSTAEERREDVLEAALIEFAAGGLDGTSTDAIARRAGISQPYLFRLYPTKKSLFVAAVERTFGRVIDAFGKATVGLTGLEAKEAMGDAYTELLHDQTFLQLQMHSYAAACGDEEIRAATRRGFSRLWDEVIILTGMDPETSREFMAFGMLLNVAAAMGIAQDAPQDLCERLLGVNAAAAFATMKP
jgi:AcrR family transcriptional regulator